MMTSLCCLSAPGIKPPRPVQLTGFGFDCTALPVDTPFWVTAMVGFLAGLLIFLVKARAGRQRNGIAI